MKKSIMEHISLLLAAISTAAGDLVPIGKFIKIFLSALPKTEKPKEPPNTPRFGPTSSSNNSPIIQTERGNTTINNITINVYPGCTPTFLKEIGLQLPEIRNIANPPPPDD
jgi:hypothetical protein